MTHLGDVVFRRVCMHKAHIRARRGYETTREAFAKSREENERSTYAAAVPFGIVVAPASTTAAMAQQ